MYLYCTIHAPLIYLLIKKLINCNIDISWYKTATQILLYYVARLNNIKNIIQIIMKSIKLQIYFENVTTYYALTD